VTNTTDPSDALNDALAAELRAERGVKGTTFATLKAQSGISESTLMRLFKGERDLRASHLILLAEALEISPADLIARAEKRVADGK
jgi:transcriptional regulator with XRE-family HTH domain